MITLLFIYIILIFFIVIDYKNTKFIFTPIKIFNMVWLIVLSMYQLNLSYIQQSFSDRTLIIFLLSILSYDITAFIYKMSSKKIKSSSSEKKQILNKKVKTTKKVNQLIKIINITFIICFMIEVFYSKGIPIIWKIMGRSETYIDFGIPSFHGMLNGFATLMGTYLLFKKKDKSKYIYLIYSILIISRQVLISIFIQAIIYNILLNIKQKKKVKYKKYIVILCIILILFIIMGNFRSNNVMKANFQPRKGYENLSEGIMWIYSYVEFPFSNFNNLVSMTNGGVNYGASIINSILPTVLTNMHKIKLSYSPYYLVSTCFTVSTYLPEIYLDFGLIGIIMFNSLIAILGVYLYQEVYNTKKIKWILIYSVFLHNIILIFFVNMFIYLPVICQYIYIMLLFKNENIEEEESWLV